MVFMTAMREIETRHIHAGLDYFFEHFGRVGGRPDCADYFCISETVFHKMSYQVKGILTRHKP